MPVWFPVAHELPAEGIVVNTKIEDAEGVRNQQKLIYKRNLWWLSDMSMYVYYTPTHWRY